MRDYRREHAVRLDGGIYLYLAAMFLLLPFSWIITVLLSIAIHEGCHLMALRLLRVRVTDISIGIRGIRISTAGMAAWQELLCAFAGPVGSFGLLLLGRWFPLLAVCGFVHGAYNLLPIYPSDGGRGLACLTQLIFPPSTAQWICKGMEAITMVGVALLCVYTTVFLDFGILPVVVGLAVLLVNMKKGLQRNRLHSTIGILQSVR